MLKSCLKIAIGSAVMWTGLGFAQHDDHDAHKHQEMEPVSIEMSGESIYQLDSEWINSKGERLKLADLANKPVVTAMIYTSCEFACPLIVGKMLAIYGGLDEHTRQNTRFVLFSFDPERDTPDKLQPYKVNSSIDLPEWMVLTAGDDEALELAISLGVRYKPTGGGDFAHSNSITVLDRTGVPVVQLPKLDMPNETAIAAIKASL